MTVGYFGILVCEGRGLLIGFDEGKLDETARCLILELTA